MNSSHRTTYDSQRLVWSKKYEDIYYRFQPVEVRRSDNYPVFTRKAPVDPKRVLTTVGFQALQFNTEKKQFVATRKVPIAVGGESQDRSFAAMVRGAKADLQSASSFSLTWLAPVQRFQS